MDGHDCCCHLTPPCWHCTECPDCENERALDDDADAYFDRVA